MSSSDRRTFLTLLAALPAAACGFTPAYGPGGPAAGLQGQVRADDPSDKAGFDFVGRIEERLGPPQGAKYRLSYRIETSTKGIAITPENVTTRYNVDGSVAYALHDASGKVVTEGKVSSFTSYSATGSTVATLAVQADAETRLMRILADDIVTRLIGSAGAWNK
ncbi:LPS assembly lipoprotein LptE [Acidimangrovimonas pyrenivorans]|uniref:LPS assembly lipoprotein LptE n=1 Tax=Acidimangrovimonas pyrenivorans TaxID=2030798 RepID=A0ABV7AET3_9RHOB